MANPATTLEERQAQLAAERQRIETILASLETKIKRVRPPLLYSVQLLLTAFVMLTLPLIYLAMIAAVAYGIFLHITHFLGALGEDSDARISLIGFTAPLFAGFTVLGILIKPIFARPAGGIPPRPLKREEEPMLFEFVDRLCKCVRCPRPSRIEVDCQVNAAAGPRRGLFSLLTGNLTLRIGLPLVEGLTVRQFAGVLAHEFGHFGQGGAMTLNHLIRRINFWFAQVVHGRDNWDAKLEDMAKRGMTGMLAALLTRLVIWIVRGILHVLMWIGAFVSSGMMRQMEYDADRYEARVAGEGQFEATMIRLLLMDAAWAKTRMELEQAWDEKHLGDQLPALIADNCNRMGEETRMMLLKSAGEAKTKLFDSHPSMTARIKRLGREKWDGIIGDEGPASFLFRKYDALCKTVTMDYYSGSLGARLGQAKLMPSAEMIRQREGADGERAIAERFSGGSLFFPELVVPETTEMGAPADPKAAVVELQKQRRMMGNAGGVTAEALKRFKEAGLMRLEAHVAESLMDARIAFRASDFGLAKRKPEDARKRAQSALRMREDSLMEVHPMHYAIRRRILCALQLLYTPQLRQRLADAERIAGEAEGLVRGLRSLDAVQSNFDTLKSSVKALEVLLKNVKGREKDEKFIRQLLRQARLAQEDLARMREGLGWTDYPFAHGAGKISLGEYIVQSIPGPKEIGQVFSQGEQALDRSERFYYRATGAVMKIVEQIEAAIGIGSEGGSKASATEMKSDVEIPAAAAIVGPQSPAAPPIGIIAATAPEKPERDPEPVEAMSVATAKTHSKPKYQPLPALRK